MYAAVPSTMPLRVIRVWSAAVAIPRSASFVAPSSRSSTFPGFTSRCTTPWEWAWSRASPSSEAIRPTRRGSSGPRLSACESDSPSTYSMTISTPSSSTAVS